MEEERKYSSTNITTKDRLKLDAQGCTKRTALLKIRIILICAIGIAENIIVGISENIIYFGEVEVLFPCTKVLIEGCSTIEHVTYMRDA